MTDEFQIVKISVNALVMGGRVMLLDHAGGRIGTPRKRSLVEGDLPQAVAARWLWLLATTRISSAFSNRMRSRGIAGWALKASNLAKTLRLRALSTPVKVGGKTRLETYPTRRWVDARQRLWHQIHNRYRKSRMTGWQRWAATVSNRFNKKKGCRYAQDSFGQAGGDQGVPDHGDD